jgi:hypothetical protein
MNAEEIADKLLSLKNKADHDPQVQNYLSKAALPANLEYVKPERSGRRAGYFRRKPGRDSLKQLKHRLRFSEIAHSRFGIKGTIPLKDGRRISKVAELIGNELRETGNNDQTEKERENLIKILRSGEVTRRIVQLSWI